MCSEILDEIYPSVKKSIGLEVKPRLEFRTIEGNNMMEASGEIYTAGAFCDIFNRTITKTESNNVIGIDLAKLADTLKQYRMMFLRNTDKIVIKHLLYHEMRHLWQFETGYKRIGTTYEAFKIQIFEVPHGFDEFEVDANEYAISMAKNGLEKAVSEVKRVLKDDGIMFICNEAIPNEEDDRQKELIELLDMEIFSEDEFDEYLTRTWRSPC